MLVIAQVTPVAGTNVLVGALGNKTQLFQSLRRFFSILSESPFFGFIRHLRFFLKNYISQIDTRFGFLDFF